MERAESEKESSNECCREYNVPTIEIIVVEVEQGFAASPDTEGTGGDMPWG